MKRIAEKDRLKTALLVAIIAGLFVCGSLLGMQHAYAGGSGSGMERVTFAKVDENGQILENVTFKLVDSEGNDVTWDGSYQNISTYTEGSAHNLMVHVDNLFMDGASGPRHDIDYYVEMVEENTPEGYEPADKVRIKATNIEWENFAVSVDGHELIFNSDNFQACLSDDPGGVVTAKYKDNYISGTSYKPANFLIINYKKVKIAKKDDAGAYLAGATLEITGKTKDNNPIQKKTITSAAEMMTVGLPAGTYTLHEVSPPDGYEPAEDITFTFTAEGKILVDGEEVEAVTMVDPKTYTPTPKLSIKKTSNVTKAKPGDVIPYTITIKNTGDADAEDVIVLDTMGNNLTYVSDDSNGVNDGQKVSWNVKVAAGETKLITINCRINEDAVGKIINNVEITNVKSEYIEPSGEEDSFVLGIYEEEEDDDDEPTVTKGVKTGDDTTPAGVLFLLIASVAAFMLMVDYRLKRNSKSSN